VARVAGMPLDRVERFAAPVIAEREHVATMAMTSSVRRRGETSGHRNLRVAVTERLVARGVDIDAIAWDSYRQDDGRWTVTADYNSVRPAGRRPSPSTSRLGFSFVNDEAHGCPGSRRQSPQGRDGRRRDGGDDTDPALDLGETRRWSRGTRDGGTNRTATHGRTQHRPGLAGPEPRSHGRDAEPPQDDELPRDHVRDARRGRLCRRLTAGVRRS
jgi:hypothetical protein